jgi:hypothetical protein
MAAKRKQPPSSMSNGSPYVKRVRPASGDEEIHERGSPSSAAANPPQQPWHDPIYGQKHAFPGLDDPLDDDGELFYGPADDGIEYLRMVR